MRARDWGRVLGKYVYENLDGAEFTVYAENGQPEVIEFAKLNDRVWKDGAKNGHKVIDKLARYRGDNVKALATVHLPELLATSRYEKATDEHSHQWMDENGWELRTAYFQDRNGNIYAATLNIANGRDRRILYAISNVRQIDKNRAARGDVPSSVAGRGSLTKSNSTSEIVTDKAESVKQRFSYAGENADNAEPEGLRLGAAFEEHADESSQLLNDRYSEYGGRSLTKDPEIVRELEQDSETRYSISRTDDQGRQLSRRQAEYFKNSQARDENGNLVTVYHSSPTAGFYKFDGSKGNGNYKYGDYDAVVTFFTDRKTMAESYAPTNDRVDTRRNGRFKDGLQELKRQITGESAPRYSGQYEGYVNITKPYVVDAKGMYWSKIYTGNDKFGTLTEEELAALKDYYIRDVEIPMQYYAYDEYVSTDERIRSILQKSRQGGLDANEAKVISAFNKIGDIDELANFVVELFGELPLSKDL